MLWRRTARRDGRLLPSSLDRRRVVRALRRVGFAEVREGGRHTVLLDADRRASIVLPRHSRIRRGTLRAELRRANVTLDEFMEVY